MVIKIPQSTKWRLQIRMSNQQSKTKTLNILSQMTKEKQQQILIFKKMEPANILHFCFKSDWNH